MRFTVLFAALLVACGTPPADPDTGTTDVVVGADARDAGADLESTDVLEAGATDVTDATPVDARANCTDVDGDGYGTGAGCLGPDCNDADRDVHPGAMDRYCNGVDWNCDGVRFPANLDYACQLADYGVGPPRWSMALCVSRDRTTFPDPSLAPHLVRTTVAHCQACRAEPSEPSGYACVCWDIDDPTREQWACDSRP